MNLIGVVALLISLSACAQQKLTQSQCVVGHGSGFVGTTGNQELITVAENGSPCAIDVTGERRGWGQFGLGGQIETPPAHGAASVHSTAYVAQIVYTPAPNFVGNDSFVVAFGPDFNAR
jgi:Bacterial Ig domain